MIAYGKIGRKALSVLLSAILVFSVITSAIGTPRSAFAAGSVNLVANPSFEESWDFANTNDWQYSGTAGAGSISSEGTNSHTGTRYLKHYADVAYQFTVSKSITGLVPGVYQLGAWEMGDSGAGDIRLFVTQNGVTEYSEKTTHSGYGNWSNIIFKDIVIASDTATIGIEVEGASKAWGVLDDVDFHLVQASPTWGADKQVEATAIGASSVTLAWSGVNDAGNVTSYRVIDQAGVVRGTSTGTTLFVDQLTPSTSYTFKVEASYGGKAWSTTGPSATITTAAASGAVPSWTSEAALTASSLTSRGVVLSWSGATDDVGVTGYRILQNGQVKVTLPANASRYQATDLSPGASYSFKVEAGNAASLWSNNGPTATVNTPHTPASDFIKGADISTLQAIEDAGGKYYQNGKQRDLLEILKDNGVNYVRLRLWNDPVQAGGYNDKAHTIAMAKRVKTAGFKLLLDFHYSDFWADPGSQVKPAAWADLSFDDLNAAVYSYTANVMNTLKEENAYPDMVQIGNEINPGMMLPDGSISNYNKLAQLLGNGIKAVRDTTPDGKEVKIMLHLAEGGDNGKFRSFFDAMKARNVDYDVIGLSFYPYWHGTFKQLKDNLNDLATRFGKELVVVETAHPQTLEDGDGWGNIAKASDAEKAGFPATPEGQAAEFTMVMNTVAHTTGGKGVGAFYWEPAWIPVPKDSNGDYQAGWKVKEGNAWDNQAMFDAHGNALSSLNAFKFNANQLPEIAAVRVMPLDGLTVSANEPAATVASQLPATVGVLFNEGSIETASVTWSAISQDRLSRVGTFTVSGTVAGTGMTARQDITVTAYRNLLVNPGFETPPANAADIPGWDLTGTAGAAIVKNQPGNAQSGQRAVNYWSESAYGFKLFQTVEGLRDGTYTLKAKVSGQDPDGEDNSVNLYAVGYGGDRLVSEKIVNKGWNVWGTYSIENIHVKGGKATLGIEVDTAANIWGWIDSFEFFEQTSVPVWTSSASLLASEVSSNSLKLSWSGLADPSSAAAYKIYRDGLLLKTVTGTNAVIADLTPNTAYSFKVEASEDSSIWTSNGPSVQATTLSGSNGGTTATNGKVWTVKSDALASFVDGSAVVAIPTDVTEIRLPASALEALGDHSISFRTSNLVIDIPAVVIAELKKSGNVQDGYVSVSFKQLSSAKDLLDRAKEKTNADIRSIGNVYDFTLSLVGNNGSANALTEFAEPITLRFAIGAEAFSDRAGVYFVSGDGNIEYVGGVWKDGFITAKVHHFSAYAVLELHVPFADVTASHWAYKAVDVLAAKLYMKGTGAQRFDPAKKITRAEFAAMLARALKLKQPKAGSSQPFADVASDAWFAGEVGAAQAAGIVKGLEGNRFGPNEWISRQEMAVMAMRAYRYLNERDSMPESSIAFADADRIASWAGVQVSQAQALGLFQGQGNNRFAPQSATTRAEAAQLLYNLLR
ncbi:glycosyl hydrolase 53 family protein [Cohnella endophytica]|nr:glycosyl hydrolase 53 family protein [Cohnella endophytica]